jgi:hypothetical protein
MSDRIRFSLLSGGMKLLCSALVFLLCAGKALSQQADLILRSSHDNLNILPSEYLVEI